jgi:hypothetical protein
MRSLVVLRITILQRSEFLQGPVVVRSWEGDGSAYTSVSRITIALSPPIMGSRAPKGRFQAENTSYATEYRESLMIYIGKLMGYVV